MRVYINLQHAIMGVWSTVLNIGQRVDQKNWQGKEEPTPMFEAEDVDFKALMPPDRDIARELIKPNLPWADEHFKERIGGLPLNPPPSHAIWPFNKNLNTDFMKGEKFDHTYPERFWPKSAGKPSPAATRILKQKGVDLISYNKGIRFNYGDLSDVITKLAKDPYTRQAYLPIWFPEDTGKEENIRVPCSLGYHFMIRNGRLDIKYIMRSTDMLRHFQDDIYLCYLLAHHVFHVLKGNEGLDELKHLGYMSFLTFSAHIFNHEVKLLNKKLEEWKSER